MVSGLATKATSFRALRPSRLAQHLRRLSDFPILSPIGSIFGDNLRNGFVAVHVSCEAVSPKGSGDRTLLRCIFGLRRSDSRAVVGAVTCMLASDFFREDVGFEAAARLDVGSSPVSTATFAWTDRAILAPASTVHFPASMAAHSTRQQSMAEAVDVDNRWFVDGAGVGPVITLRKSRSVYRCFRSGRFTRKLRHLSQPAVRPKGVLCLPWPGLAVRMATDIDPYRGFVRVARDPTRAETSVNAARLATFPLKIRKVGRDVYGVKN
jgi:hypothetical protein